MKTLYETLEISPDATQDEIKEAFKKLAMKYHPDKEGGDTEKMQEINKAYSVLKDTIKRKRYDTTGGGESVDNSAAELMSVVFQIVSEIIQKNPWNIEQELKKISKNVENNYNQSARIIASQIEKVIKFKDRIVTGGDSKVFETFIEGNLNQLKQQQAQEKLVFERTVKALEKFSGYTFTIEPEHQRTVLTPFIVNLEEVLRGSTSHTTAV